MSDKIGPTFLFELRAAGVAADDVPSWFPDTGEILYPEGATAKFRSLVDGVLAKHDPTATPSAAAPAVPQDLDNLIGALQAEGVLTPAKAAAVRNRVKK